MPTAPEMYLPCPLEITIRMSVSSFCWYDALRHQVHNSRILSDPHFAQFLSLLVKLILAVEHKDNQHDICDNHCQRHRLRAESGRNTVGELARLLKCSRVHRCASA